MDHMITSFKAPVAENSSTSLLGKRGSGDSISSDLQKRVKTGDDSFKIPSSVTSEKKSEVSKNYEQEVIRNIQQVMSI